jgi:hypothetical protein
MHCEGLFTCKRCVAIDAMWIVETYALWQLGCNVDCGNIRLVAADAATRRAECYENTVDECNWGRVGVMKS